MSQSALDSGKLAEQANAVNEIYRKAYEFHGLFAGAEKSAATEFAFQRNIYLRSIAPIQHALRQK
ncbi:MAG: hypothetical protein EA339_10125 [Rhodobacteraceae bacterium]|nr:MAG: hypothetical protein EA339_10125 [Paracoccaceae bacterium]